MRNKTAGDLVSVIVPAFDAAEFIAETLESALSQDYPNLEVLVIDDGSTDGTASIVETMGKQDSRLRLHRQPNLGLSVARNVGIERTSGKYVATLDADDLWHPEKLSRQMDTLLSAGPDTGLVYTWMSEIDEAGRVVGRNHGGATYQGRVLGAILVGNFVGCGSVPLMRRTAITEAGGYDPALHSHEDLDLYRRMAQRCEFAIVPEHLVGYRQTGRSMSDDWIQMERSEAALLEKADKELGGLPPRIHRWSRSGITFYLARKAMRQADHRQAASYLCRILGKDPVYLAYRTYRWMVERMTPSIRSEKWPTEAGAGLRRSQPRVDGLWDRRAASIQQYLDHKPGGQ